MANGSVQLKAVLAALAEDASPGMETTYFPAFNAATDDPVKIKLQTIVDAVMNEIGEIGGGGSWGEIEGNLSDQTDLQQALDAKAPDSRTISAGTGLSGGGNLTANRTLSLDINGLTEETAASDADFIAVHTANGIRKMSRANFLDGLGGAASPLDLQANNAAEVPLAVRGAAGQSANLQEWQNHSGTVKARINANGEVAITKKISFADYGDMAIGNLFEDGNLMFEYNNSKSIKARDNAGIFTFQIDSGFSSNNTAMLIYGDGAMRRVKMDAASGGKRALYVDA